jgi:hypothetical protein
MADVVVIAIETARSPAGDGSSRALMRRTPRSCSAFCAAGGELLAYYRVRRLTPEGPHAGSRPRKLTTRAQGRYQRLHGHRPSPDLGRDRPRTHSLASSVLRINARTCEGGRGPLLNASASRPHEQAGWNNLNHGPTAHAGWSSYASVRESRADGVTGAGLSRCVDYERQRSCQLLSPR